MSLGENWKPKGQACPCGAWNTGLRHGSRACFKPRTQQQQGREQAAWSRGEANRSKSKSRPRAKTKSKTEGNKENNEEEIRETNDEDKKMLTIQTATPQQAERHPFWESQPANSDKPVRQAFEKKIKSALDLLYKELKIANEFHGDTRTIVMEPSMHK